MSGIPEYYLGGTPNPNSGLSPLQLALFEHMRNGTENPIFINSEFAQEMHLFTNSNPILPLNVQNAYSFDSVYSWNPLRTQFLLDKITTQFSTGITGRRFIIIGDQIFIERVAQDCGPDEDVRYELVQVGKKSEIAEGTFAVYGKIVYGGKLASATYNPSYVPNVI